MSVDHMMEIAHNENMMQMQTGGAGNDEECYSSFIVVQWQENPTTKFQSCKSNKNWWVRGTVFLQLIPLE